MALRDVVDVALNYRVALFDVEPSGVPSFQRGIQWYINVLAGHPIPELQVHAVDNLGTTAAFFLQTEQVPEEVEMRKNTQKRLIEMDKDHDVQYGVGGANYRG